MNESTVIKRNGSKQSVDFNKIKYRLDKLCNKDSTLSVDNIVEFISVNTTNVTQKTIEKLYPNIATQELDGISADVCSEYTSKVLILRFLRILVSYLAYHDQMYIFTCKSPKSKFAECYNCHRRS